MNRKSCAACFHRERCGGAADCTPSISLTPYVPAIEVAKTSTPVSSRYRLVSRQPAASASSTEQNQRVPLLIFISIFAYQRLDGW